MKTHFLQTAALGSALAAALLGCASPNVNPRAPKADTGYVDLHAPAADALYWDVARFDPAAHRYKTVFSRLDPVDGGVLRLAFAPGRHRLRVTFLNRVINHPVELEVAVQDGKITPVPVTLAGAGNVGVQSKVEVRGGSAYGRNGQRIKVVSDESTMYDLSAAAGEPVAYQPREKMPYYAH